jgi:type II secretory pathway component PulM
MMTRMIDLLLRRSRRERRLLGVLTGVLAAALLWLWLISPLLTTRATLQRQLTQAQALQHWVAERAADQLLLGQATDQIHGPPIGISGLEQGLVVAGLRAQVTRLSGQGDGEIDLAFEAVEFTALARWLSQMDPGWGYEIIRLRLHRHTDPGLVAAELVLAPQRTP